ncbi:MAG: hypothetical protein JWM14_1376 [Chitinophagaceae bacterium]|nr:hypothetical protein [Chitinophagaceae bacterium]
MKIWLTLILTIVLFIENGYAQQFQLNGDGLALGGNAYRLTLDDYNRAGSMWYKLDHDLNKPFSITGQLLFGGRDVFGADGIAFVFQNGCLNAGTAGGGIGYSAMPGKSFAVEFDTFENSAATGSFENHDPAYDHIAVEKMGNVDHANATDNLFGPVQASAAKANIEDSLWYDFTISYDPVSHLFQVYFDGTLRVSMTYDIYANIFAPDPYVYWGFTSSTGGQYNYQAVYINKNLTTYALPDKAICPGGSVSVSLPPISRFSGRNVALGKATLASSMISSPSEAVDGNVNSRWESIQAHDPEWMYVDLGSPHDIDSIKLDWETAYASLYHIDVSSDAVTWTTIYNETDPTRLSAYVQPNLIDTIIVSASNVRYVRMYGTARATPYGYSIHEFQIFGKPKYVWSPNDGSISPDINSANPTFTPAVTTTYSLVYPDFCTGAVIYNMTITVDCTLPLELTSFDVIKVGNKGHLTWTTSLEENTHHFTIMKSLDGINFTPLGRVAAAGNSHSLRNYYFDDTDLPASGTVYYQLVTTDIDGSSNNSPIRLLNLKEENLYISSPVFDEETSLILPGETKSLQLTVVDAVGRVLLEEYHTDVTSPVYFGKSLPPTVGFYVVIVQTETLNKTFKVVKRK